MRLMPFLGLTIALGLGACNEAQRLALGLSRPAGPVGAVSPQPRATTIVADQPPVAAPQHIRHRAERVAVRSERTFTRRSYTNPETAAWIATSVQMEQTERWRGESSEGLEAFSGADQEPSAAGLGSDGYLTWPGKRSARP